jgi:hypothetical protein
MKKYFAVSIITLFHFFLEGQNVNQFNGSFNYRVPLLHLPSDRGDGVAIDASYTGGIQVNQPASPIGLGWSLNSDAAVYRSVSGFPDDTKTFQNMNMLTGQNVVGQGALYPGIGSATDYDLVSTNKGSVLDTTAFTFPAYDNFSVNAPAFGGQMKLSYLNFYGYVNQNISTTTPIYKVQPTSFSSAITYRKPQFHFVGDFADTLVSRHYPTPITSTTSLLLPTNSVTGLGYTTSTVPFIGEHFSGTSIINQNFDMGTGRLASSNFVEYFTNQDIDNANTNSFTVTTDPLTTSTLNPFIDYKSSHDRSSSIFPAEGIGYFRITASNGLTYHYSLPVYETQNIVYNIPLKNDYSLPSVLATSYTMGLVNPSDSTFEYYDGTATQITNTNFLKYTNTNKYATKWLLTAITGRDYQDVNNNHQVDDSDAGYWISYDYQLWSSDFVTRSPQYGYDYLFSPEDASKSYPDYFLPEPVAPSSAIKLSLFASANISRNEVYYLSKIRTSSHTAVFVMDTRKDEKGGVNTDYVKSGFKPAPSLRVKRILLFNNSDFASISGSNSYNQSNFSDNTLFNFIHINTSSTFYTEAWYQSVFPGANNYILKNVEFDQDYSLCPGYHGNINVSCTTSSPLLSPAQVQHTLSVSNYTTSGKLTLNRILTYDLHNVKVTPSTVFSYQPGAVNGNPEYNPIQADYWGYFKSDATTNGYSRYTSAVSKDYTQAWSLSSITDALGGITQIEYESNSYNKVLDAEEGTRGPAFIYRVRDVNKLYFDFDILMEEGSDPSYPLNEFVSLANSTLPGLKKTLCLPYSNAISAVSSAAYIASITFSNGLAFGDCSTFSIIPGSGNQTDNIRGACGFYAALSLNCNSRKYDPDDLHFYDSIIQHSGSSIYNDIAYAGGGYVQFETPIGYEAYGGGVRVKNIKTQNSTYETYVDQYSYENGVAGNEMDRFDFQVNKSGHGGNYGHYDYLRPKSYDLFEMSPTIGYTKVTMQNLGRINTANGRTENIFVTDPVLHQNGQFSNYTITAIENGYPYFYTINECINKFSSIFGATQETNVFDKNNNQISKTDYEYVPVQQGAMVENFYFSDLDPSVSTNSAIVNILREFPAVLKSTTTYGMGTVKKTETLVRDEWTGEGTTIRSTGINNSSSLSYKIPAYKYYLPIESPSLTYTSSLSRKMLPFGEDLYTYTNVDTTLSPAQTNGYSASFSNAAYKLYSKKLRQLQYSSTGTVSPADVTLDYYINNRRFQFDGGQGSMDHYGLLEKSALNTNTLNPAATNTTSIWEPGSNSFNWRLTSEIMLIDAKKHVVEARDVNNRFGATKYGYSNYYVNAYVSNCNYASFSFADFEGPIAATYAGSVTRFDGDLLTTSYAFTSGGHTGSQCIAISNTAPLSFISASAKSPGNSLDIGLLPGRIYRASVWVSTTNLANAEMDITVSGVVNGSTSVSNSYTANSTNSLVTTIGSWNLLQADFAIPEGFSTGSSGQFKIDLKSNSGTVYFDDFIFHPVESSFSANVYDIQSGRVVSSLDGNGMATTNVYDASGKPVEVWKEFVHLNSTSGVFKKIRGNTYNYGRGASN